jgi:hypothetical protein
MTESKSVESISGFQDEFDFGLTMLSIKFLKFIKKNFDKGNELHIKDFMKRFNYDRSQTVSKYLDILEEKQLIESYYQSSTTEGFKGGYPKGLRVVRITAKGLRFIYSLFLSDTEQALIEKLRKDGDVNMEVGTVSLIISEFTENSASIQDHRIKTIILRELGPEIVPESILENICRKVRQIQLESGQEFIRDYTVKHSSS